MTVTKKVLITGASGYLGRYAVKEFKDRGYYVRALVRNPEKIKTAGLHGEPAVY
ncbi:MAG: NmrA family NAD(P)-binding protein, partial [Chlorobiaceae bacterium]|nr:NmrA family NAD(P)-binding protein [Chlorobiaceae bacterium]